VTRTHERPGSLIQFISELFVSHTALVFVLLLLSACSSERAKTTLTHERKVTITESHASSSGDRSDWVGYVDDEPIPSVFFEEAYFLGATDWQSNLRNAAGLVLLSKEAMHQKFPKKADEGAAAYAHRYLNAVLSPKAICSTFPQKELETLYQIRKKRFIHPDVFHVVDAQYICCPREKVPCANTPALEECLNSGKKKAQSLYLNWKTQVPLDPEEAWKDSSKEEKSLGVTRYKFAYDYSTLAAEQKGKWLIIDPKILEAVRGLKSGAMTPPVQSAFGWHVLFVAEYSPPSNEPLASKSTQEALRKELCSKRQKKMERLVIPDLLEHRKITPSGGKATALWLKKAASTKGQP
jgi:hypothetical protein